jgi:single-stranded-DNA-specific exonuclease
MAVAVERLCQARGQGELVVVFGDYDVDGVTATALLFGFLRACGWRVEYYLPHRLEEGYGLTQDSLERCLKKTPARLLVVLDCGSSAVDCIGSLRAQNIDVIVVDHHQVSAPLPPALPPYSESV